MKVALHGSYYGDNFGDTLFVLEFIKWLEESGKVEKNNIYLPFAGNRVRELCDVSAQKGIWSLVHADKIIFIGGGYLGEPPKKVSKWSIRLLIRHLSIGLLAILLRKPYIFVGVGAGPLSNIFARKITTYICNRSSNVIVRDIESKEYLIDYGVKRDLITVTADSILNFDKQYVSDKYREIYLDKYSNNDFNIKNIGLHLPAISNDKINILHDIIDDLKDFTSTFTEFRVIVFNDFYKNNYRYLAYEEIIKKFDGKCIYLENYENPDQLVGLINQLDIVITTKLHCGIVANALEKYTVSISTHNKTRRLYSQLGLQNRTINFSDYKKGDLLTMMSDFSLSQRSYKNIPLNIKKLASQNEKYLLEFIQE